MFGGSANAYDYTAQNPVNQYDLTGMYTTWCSEGSYHLRYCYRYYSQQETINLEWEFYLVGAGIAGLGVITAPWIAPLGVLVALLGIGVGVMGAYIAKVDWRGRGIYIGMIQVQSFGYWWFGWHSGTWHTTWEWIGGR